MSRSATMEYIGQKRRAYSECSIAKKSRLLDEVCSTTGLSRKHVNKLLTGNIKHRDRPGRGKTYTEEQMFYLRNIWRHTRSTSASFGVMSRSSVFSANSAIIRASILSFL